MNLMRSQTKYHSSISLGVIFALVHSFAAWCATAPPQGRAGLFFSQGQSIYSPQSKSKSEESALKDLLSQAVVQAAATFLSPGQLGKHYQLIQDKILKQPDRYVQKYEVFSENAEQGGLYRITGQVMVRMDLLEEDLKAFGLTWSEAERFKPQVLSPEPEATQPHQVVGEPVKKAGISERASESGEEMLWAVSEKWGEELQLPAEGQDPEGIFVASVFQESRDYRWTIRLPQMGTLDLDGDREVSAGQALALSKALGLHYAVVGSVGLIRGEDGEVRLQARLRILSASSGKTQGEIHEELALRDLSTQEAALELAGSIVPQLDRQLRGSPQDALSTDSAATPEEAGELVLQIRSKDAYREWLALEKALREQSKDMQVKGFEIRSEMSIVRILGVNGTNLMNLNGTRLPNGLQVQITGLGERGESFSITFLKSEVSPIEPRQ
jgi:hypothetical protein